MLRRDPHARRVLDGEHQHAQPVEELQIRAVLHLDLGQRLRNGACHVGEDEHNQDPVEDTRGGIAPAPVLKDVERPLTQARIILLGATHANP